MQEIKIYTTKICPYCVRAKLVLQRNNLKFTEIDASDKREWLMEKSGQRTVPQIWIGEHHVGGSDELVALERAGKLLEMVNAPAPPL
ncbi:MAG: glutaredoxin 3 [Deltaproteobacteria bacterium]|nr:glutaredoxin 3 [Deltaproteobacteria bacterium]